MNTNRSAAYAMIIGSAAGLVTMVLHPSGHDVVSNAAAGASNMLNRSVHLLAIAAQPMVVAGSLGLTIKLNERRDLAFGAFTFFLLGSFAVILAAIASGLVSPAVVRGLDSADEAGRAAMMSDLRFSGILNQAFAKIYVMLAGFAILLWSAAMLIGRQLSRALGIYGVLLGTAFVGLMIFNALRLDIHGFGAVAILTTVWFAWSAVTLLKDEP